VDETQDVQMTGIQIRGHKLRVLTATEREATFLRTNDRWMNQLFEGARTRGEDWYFGKCSDVGYIDVEHGSDHQYIAATFSDKTAEGPRPPKLNFRKTGWNRIHQDLGELVGYVSNITSVEDLENQAITITHRLQEATAKEHFGQAIIIYGGRWDDELSMLHSEYTTLYNKGTNASRNRLLRSTTSDSVDEI